MRIKKECAMSDATETKNKLDCGILGYPSRLSFLRNFANNSTSSLIKVPWVCLEPYLILGISTTVKKRAHAISNKDTEEFSWLPKSYQMSIWRVFCNGAKNGNPTKS